MLHHLSTGASRLRTTARPSAPAPTPRRTPARAPAPLSLGERVIALALRRCRWMTTAAPSIGLRRFRLFSTAPVAAVAPAPALGAAAGAEEASALPLDVLQDARGLAKSEEMRRPALVRAASSTT
eukprot:6830835-Prymnesium_polylepis.2